MGVAALLHPSQRQECKHRFMTPWFDLGCFCHRAKDLAPVMVWLDSQYGTLLSSYWMTFGPRLWLADVAQKTVEKSCNSHVSKGVFPKMFSKDDPRTCSTYVLLNHTIIIISKIIYVYTLKTNGTKSDKYIISCKFQFVSKRVQTKNNAGNAMPGKPPRKSLKASDVSVALRSLEWNDKNLRSWVTRETGIVKFIILGGGIKQPQMDRKHPQMVVYFVGEIFLYLGWWICS